MHLFKRAVCAVSEERQEIGTVILGIEDDLFLVVLLAFVVIPLKQFMEILWGEETSQISSRLNLES